MGTILAVANQKGGVGKTTTCVNLAAALGERGKRVLLIDLDPQASLTMSLGIDTRDAENTAYDLLNSVSSQAMNISPSPTSLPGVSVIPSTIELVKAEIEVLRGVYRERTLQAALEKLKAEEDWTILDCPPSLGQLTVNALAAADEVLIPLQTDYLAMRGAVLLIQKGIHEIKARVNPKLHIIGILATLYDMRTTHAREVLEGLRAHFGRLVFRSVIKQAVALKNAAVERTSVLQYAPRSDVAQAYRNLAAELLQRHKVLLQAEAKRKRRTTAR